MKLKHYFYLGLVVLGGIGAILLVGFIRPYTYQGSLIDPPSPAPDFQLIDQNGQPASLSDLRGVGDHKKVLLIFFGFTHCPDVCPITLADFVQVKSRLGDQADNVAFVFITVDPERDTSETIRNHLSFFDPSFIGLTGTQQELETVWKDYGVYRAMPEVDGPSNYEVDHSTYIYAIDLNGNLRLTYPYDAGADLLSQDILHLLKEG